MTARRTGFAHCARTGNRVINRPNIRLTQAMKLVPLSFVLTFAALASAPAAVLGSQSNR